MHPMLRDRLLQQESEMRQLAREAFARGEYALARNQAAAADRANAKLRAAARARRLARRHRGQS